MSIRGHNWPHTFSHLYLIKCRIPSHFIILCNCPWLNQPYCTLNRFWVKVTITNYDLWTTAPANLKSLDHVDLEIWAEMYPDHQYWNFTANTMKHWYIRCTWKSVYSLFMQSMWPHPPSQWARWLPKCLERAAAVVSTKKNDKTSVSKDR